MSFNVFGQGEKASLGTLEFAVLSSIITLRERAYGVPIWEMVCEKVGRQISIGAIYTTLGRLERKGLLSSWQGEATAERGGRAKRYFKIEAPGVRALNNFTDTVNRFRGLVPQAVASET